eukprot:649671-Pyramimonas_sp.AAC.1
MKLCLSEAEFSRATEGTPVRSAAPPTSSSGRSSFRVNVPKREGDPQQLLARPDYTTVSHGMPPSPFTYPF